jgi:hypothetical protein
LTFEKQAVRNVNEFLGPRVIGMEAASQADIDKALLEVDRTENKVENLACVFLFLMFGDHREAWVQMRFWECPWLCAKPELLLARFPCTICF